MVDPSLVIFAVESGVKLGRKLYDVLVDETVERPLVFPVGNLFADVELNDALDYFREHRELIRSGGPYAGLSDEEKLKAYKTIRLVGDRLGGSAADADEASEIVLTLHRFEQFRAGFGANPPLQRILGTVVEIGIDYFVASPELLQGESSGKKILRAFVLRLDDIDFAESSGSQIAGDLLLASLRTFSDSVVLVDDDARFQALVGGVTTHLIADIEAIRSAGKRVRREDLFRRIASSVLRGGGEAFTENIDLFIPKDKRIRPLVQSTLEQFLGGIEGKEDIFTNESVDILFKSALTAVGENSELFVEEKILQELIGSTVEALTKGTGGRLFSEETVAAILRASLETVRDNIETLIDFDNPQKQLLASAVRSLAASLADVESVRDLFSKQQWVELAQVTFEEIAKHPEQLLGDSLDNDKKTALAQIIRSVAKGLGEDPQRFVTGAGFVELARTALRVAVENADKLIDLETSNPRTNVLFRIVQQTTGAILEQQDPRKIISRDVFLEISRRVLPVVSANIEGLLDADSKPVADTVRTALELASGVLENRVNGANLPVLIEGLLLRVLWSELDLSEPTAVEREALEVLRAA